ncbi:cytochrome P450 monooxygenase [Fusarium tjaetaba]|uniref:Cytochrome P450 monooxygenase n=1 Tax=Fusarium tjaetaba TaxID=1567544 RepID=A0A8H5S5Z8_9HYPO|nr:cytochrome P450 monooxygenase [Fusarium tjaetaba]KAF5645853.1 cytochrome P450 monooxygenase [Fusarium tjaetaba]
MASSEAYTSGVTQESGDLRSAPGSPLYDSLKLSGQQIRLLTIKSTMPEISCEMDVTDLHDQLPFNALSYVWGDPGITEDIFINGHKHPVTTSLASALRCVPQHLSQSKHAAGQKLWVDAICINQADDAEKSRQVAKMGEIYSQSGLVLCWLGPLSDSIGTAIDVIQITAFERYFRLERFKEVKDTKQLSVADTTFATPRQVGYIEIYELANALEHATTVTGRVLQSPYGSELEFCKNDLIILCREVRDWQDRLQRQASKLDANVIKGSHPVGFLSKLVSSRIHKFQKIVEDLVFQVIGDEIYGHLLWLKEYPSLCVVEEIVGQCHRGPAQPLFDLPYWSRIWIRQEIILAKQAVFICGPRSFSLQTLEYFSAWLGWILSPSNSRLCQKEKLFKLILAYKQNCKLLHHIFEGRRDQGLPVGNWLGQSHFKTNIWCHLSEARATNPKDYYYGFLGITKLKIVPDYSPRKSLGLVSRDFLSEYLKVYRDQSSSDDSLGGPLGLLRFAGVGYGWEADTDMPSWGPNFPGEAQSSPSSRGSADAVAFPGNRAFPDNRHIDNIFEKELHERITGPDMEVTLYILDRIEMIGPRVSDYGRPELLHSEGLPITWALDFALRHESYTSGGHPLAALRHLLEPYAASKGKETDFPIENGLEFLKFLGRFNRPFQKGKQCSRAMLARFCYVRNFLAQVPVSVSSLTLCPRLIVKDPDDDEDEDQYMKEYRYIQLLCAKCRPYNHTIAETKKGYIGRLPPRIQEGDLVCLLNGLNQPAVLRKVDHWVLGSSGEGNRSPPDDLLDYGPSGSYALGVSEDATGMRLVMSGSQWEAVEVPDDDTNDANFWYIKPIPPGSDRYSLQFQRRYQEYNSTAFRWQISGWVDPRPSICLRQRKTDVIGHNERTEPIPERKNSRRHPRTMDNLSIFTAIALCAALLWWVRSTLTSPLRQYPGPFLANYPELIKTIYGTDNKWLKTEFYLNNSTIVDGKINHNVFSTTSPAEHTQMKKPMAKYYSSSNVLTLESKMNQVIDELCKQIDDRFIEDTKSFDLAEWLGLYTWDIIGFLTFSRTFGYMANGHDFDETIIASALSVEYFAQIGQIPLMDRFLKKNPIVRIGPPDMSHVTHFAITQLQRRLEQREQGKYLEEPDFLDYFIGGMKSNPDSIDAKLVLNFLLGNILAGADTTSIALRAIFDFLLRNPHAMARLKSDILAESFDDDAVAPYSTARSLPYLDAVIRESLRMHPSVAMPLERYVPDTGLTLPDGSFVPPGVSVGLNPYIIGRNEDVWGEDANEFRPERWLKLKDESEEEYQRRLRKMNAADLTFGGGSRICIGRHIALIQIYKGVATLVSRYEIQLADPNIKMRIISGWFPRQTGLFVKMHKRSEMENL